jgi:uncharacterized protein
MMPFSPKPKLNLSPKPAALSDRTNKDHSFKLAGITFQPLLSGALWAPEFSSLLVADLHLEQGTSLARRGLYVPPFDTGATLATLAAVVHEMKPQKLFFLGDSFHDDHAQNMLAPHHVDALLKITSLQETIWLSGNHDPSVHQCAEEVALGPITLRHIPKLGQRGFEIAGHLHPGAGLVQRGVRVHRKCFVADDARVILPAFGSYTGALDVANRAFDGLFNTKTARAWLIGQTTLHCFPVKRLGR